MTPPRALELMAEVDRRVDVPLIPMTYGAIIEAYGLRGVLRAQAAAAGAEGLICVDIPPEESGDAARAAAAAEGIDLVHLVAPTSRDERLRAAASASRGFVYLVANVGHDRRPRARSTTASPGSIGAGPGGGRIDTPAARRVRHLAARRTWRPCCAPAPTARSSARRPSTPPIAGGAAELEAFVHSLATALR